MGLIPDPGTSTCRVSAPPKINPTDVGALQSAPSLEGVKGGILLETLDFFFSTQHEDLRSPQIVPCINSSFLFIAE